MVDDSQCSNRQTDVMDRRFRSAVPSHRACTPTCRYPCTCMQPRPSPRSTPTVIWPPAVLGLLIVVCCRRLLYASHVADACGHVVSVLSGWMDGVPWPSCSSGSRVPAPKRPANAVFGRSTWSWDRSGRGRGRARIGKTRTSKFSCRALGEEENRRRRGSR
jgi:hypothetical protein